MARIVFMGTPDFSVPVFANTHNRRIRSCRGRHVPDRPKGRKRVLTPPPVKVEALKHGITVLRPEKVRLDEEIDKVLALKPDLIVTAAFGQILPKRLLDEPQFGCINVHASLPPELRGARRSIMRSFKAKRKQASQSCTWWNDLMQGT